MSSNAIPIEPYAFSEDDTLFLDTNIWLSVYGPQSSPDNWRTKLYSNALKRIINAKSIVFIDVLVLSEFVNRYSRMAFWVKRPNARPNEFKKFRKSSDFKPVAKAISDDVRRILKYCQRIGSGFESIDVDASLAIYESERPDFNDMIMAELCKKNSLKLITHDADFKKFEITVLTANKNLLS